MPEDEYRLEIALVKLSTGGVQVNVPDTFHESTCSRIPTFQKDKPRDTAGIIPTQLCRKIQEHEG